jgi:hypothetical protein
MNKKVVIIFALTIIAIVVLALYSFGPLSYKRTEAKINPDSLKPISSEKTAVSNKNIVLNVYHNKDLKENYYTVKFPQNGQVQAGKKTGSYSFSYNEIKGTAELMDVPDNTTLELYILSQEEPKLKKIIGYKREEYKKLAINGNESYQLTYASKISGEDYKTIRTYIVGQDMAIVMTVYGKQSIFADMQNISSLVFNSLRWENK